MSFQKIGDLTFSSSGDTFITVGQDVVVGDKYDAQWVSDQLPTELNQAVVKTLTALIATHCNHNDLQWICAIADIDESVIIGEDNLAKAESLVQYASKHHCDLHALLQACQQEKREAMWPRWQDLYTREKAPVQRSRL